MVNMENYEEYILLYADGELTADEQQALLAFVAQHPHLQKELDAYTATILQPDTQMVFADKDSLLMKEKPKRIALLANWKVYAAAASVILFAVVFTISNNNNDVEQTPMAATDTIAKPEPIIEETPTEELIAKEDTILDQKNHAEPVEPIAVKQQPTPQPRKVETLVAQQPEPAQPEPIVEQEQEQLQEVIAIETPKDTITHEQEIVVQAVEQPVITNQPEPVVAQQEVPTKKKNGIVATAISEKVDGLGDFGHAVNEKLMAVRHVREDLKDTKVHFRIGKKELFTVRL